MSIRNRVLKLTLSLTTALFCVSTSSSAAATTAAASGAASPDANCHCEQYRALEGFSTLGLQVGVIALDAAQQPIKGRESERTISPEAAEAIRLKLSADRLIPDECRETLANVKPDPRWNLTLRHFADFSRPSPIPKRWNEDGSYMETAQLSLAIASKQHCEDKLNKAGTYTMIPAYCFESNDFNRVGEFLKLDDQEILKSLKDALGPIDSSGMIPGTPSALKIYRAYHAVMSLNDFSEANVLAKAKELGTGLSASEKISMVQMLGRRMLMNYDDERATFDTEKHKGIVSVETIMRAAASNDRNGLFGSYNKGDTIPDGYQFAGICRDIAVAQAKMLSAMGMKHTYVIASLRAGNGHATVMTQDPDDPQRSILIDYGTKEVVTARSSRQTLYQGLDDISVEYEIYDADGKPVAITPSENGKFVTEMMGFDPRTLDPMARKTSSAANLSFNLDPEGQAQLRAFYGQDGNGAKYKGAAITRDYSFGELAPGKVGVVAVARDTPVPTQGVPDTTGMLQLRIEQNLRTPKITPKDSPHDVYLSGTTMGNSKHWYVPKEKDGNTRIQRLIPPELMDIRQNIGIGYQYDDRKGLDARVYAGAQIASAHKDIREEYTIDPEKQGEVKTPMMNFAVLSSELGVRLDEENKSRAALATTLVCDAIGCRGKAEVKAVYQEVVASLSTEGRIQNDAPLIQEGSERRISAEVTAPVAAPLIPAGTTVNSRGSVSLDSGDVDWMNSVQLRF